MLFRPLILVLLVSLPALAQQLSPDTAGLAIEQGDQAFPKPSYFRYILGTPSTRVELQSPVRIADFVVDGRLELSLRAYLELVMANNTDVQLTKLTVEFSRNAITRAYSPFDPLGLASFQATRATLATTDQLQGAATLKTLSQPYNFQYQQRLETGTNVNVGFSGLKSSTNSQFAIFNPSITSQLQIGFNQPLLRNRGSYINRVPIMIAKSSLRVAEYQLRDRLLQSIQDAENAYWTLVSAREVLRVQEKALELRDVALKRTQREIELGASSRLDIYQPQVEYAATEISLIQARFRVQQVEDQIRHLISADLDPALRKLPVIPTEAVLPPEDDRPLDAEAYVERALAVRPDLKANIQRLDVDDLSIKQSANALRPALALTGSYTSFGRGGPALDRNTGRFIPGGILDAFDQLSGFSFPTYAFGLSLQLPIKNRQAAADLADSLVRKKQDALAVRSIEQTVRQDVLNAVSQVESSRASVKQATVFRDIAIKLLEAENKKYELGTSQIFFVLQYGQRLIDAESGLVTESINYRRNLLNLLRRTGELLEERGVVVP